MGFGILNFGNALNSLLATSENATKSSISIYPNPVKSNFTITTAEKIISVDLFDTLGRKVKTLTNAKTNSIEGLTKGVYFVKVKTEKNEYIEKLMKQ
jgi:hypothetical protein